MRPEGPWPGRSSGGAPEQLVGFVTARIMRLNECDPVVGVTRHENRPEGDGDGRSNNVDSALNMCGGLPWWLVMVACGGGL